MSNALNITKTAKGYRLTGIFLLCLTFLCAAGQSAEDRKNGITVYDSLHFMKGINCNSGFQFIDMHGRMIKNNNVPLCLKIDAHRYAGISGQDKFSLFYDDTIVWSLNWAPHHVAFLDEDTNIILLGYELQPDKTKDQIYYEVLRTYNVKGELIKTQSFFKLVDQLQKWLPEQRDSIVSRNNDFKRNYLHKDLSSPDSFYFHINAVQLIPPNKSEKKDSIFKHGNYLVSDFANNFIAIIDRNDFHILWLYYQSESRLGQHAAQMLKDGRMIYIVNNIPDLPGSFHSSVRILNPITKKVEWGIYRDSRLFAPHLNSGMVSVSREWQCFNYHK